MALVATRVLVINPKLKTAIRIKQALEQAGSYEVAAFTSSGAALDYLRSRPQDVVLVDFGMPELPGIDLALRVRALQPDAAIIATPDTSEVAAVARDLGFQAVLDTVIPVRQMIPVIRNAVAHMRDTLPDTAEAPALGSDSETLRIAPPDNSLAALPPAGVPEFSSLDSVLVRMGGFDPVPPDTPTVDMRDAGYARSIEFVLKEDPAAPRPVVDPKFSQLAAEEPPMPAFEDSGTVGDLMVGVSDSNLREVVDILRSGPPATLPEEAGPRRAAPQEPEAVPDDEASTEEFNTAQIILQTTLDDSTPFSLDQLLSNIDVQAGPSRPGIKPLPSWIEEMNRYVREPDFLPSHLPELDTMSDSSIQTTRMAHPEELVPNPTDMETDRLGPQMDYPPPPDTLPEMPRPAPPPIVPDDDEITERLKFRDEPPDYLPEAAPQTAPQAEVEPEIEPEAELQPEPEMIPDMPDVDAFGPPGADEEQPEPVEDVAAPQMEMDASLELETAPAQAAEFDSSSYGIIPPQVTVGTQSDDPQLAQLALTLTQASLELTAEATLLARDGQIVAYSGMLPIEDVRDLGGAIGYDWEAEPQEARIRFVNLPGSGKDYMLYSRRTEDGFTLTMIFAGNMPLRVIRRQSDRLVHALETVPEPPPAEMVIDAPETLEVTEAPEAVIAEEPPPAPAAPVLPARAGPLTAYGFLWLIRDPEQPLDNEVAQAIVGGLDYQLTHEGWEISTFQVFEDYVYLVADVPGEIPAHDLIEKLMRQSAELAFGADTRIDPERLWADSYLIVFPARELDIEEIQSFINFARVR